MLQSAEHHFSSPSIHTALFYCIRSYGASCPMALVRDLQTLLLSSGAHGSILCLCSWWQDLLKHTPVSHPDHPLLQDALRISQNFLSSINEEITPRRQSMTVKKGEVSLPASIIFSVPKYWLHLCEADWELELFVCLLLRNSLCSVLVL